MRHTNWKADEMEMAINFRAIRLSYLFSTAALLLFCGYEFIANGELPTVPFLILCVQNLVFFTAKLAMTRKLSQGEGDEE